MGTRDRRSGTEIQDQRAFKTNRGTVSAVTDRSASCRPPGCRAGPPSPSHRRTPSPSQSSRCSPSRPQTPEPRSRWLWIQHGSKRDGQDVWEEEKRNTDTSELEGLGTVVWTGAIVRTFLVAGLRSTGLGDHVGAPEICKAHRRSSVVFLFF